MKKGMGAAGVARDARAQLGCVVCDLPVCVLPRFAAWVYGMALVAMFGASALYHRYPFKSAARRVWARRLDHSRCSICWSTDRAVRGSLTRVAKLAAWLVSSAA